MANCQDIEANLAAYVDGECGAVDRTVVEEHVRVCPPCRARVVSERATHDLLHERRLGLRGCAPDTLRQRCAAHRAIGASDAAVRRRPWIPLSLAATLMLATGVLLLFGWGSSVETYAAQLAADHLKCFQFPPEAVAVDAVAAGRTWQAANGWPLRVAASVPAEQLELLGVRRCGSTSGRVAHLLYRWRGQPLSVYVLNKRLEQAVEAGHQPDHDSVVRLGEQAIIWSEKGRTYAVVARRRSVPDLEQVVPYVRRAIE